MSTWWIDEPFLLGSGNPSDAELQELYEKGFRIIISLLDDIKQPLTDKRTLKSMWAPPMETLESCHDGRAI